MEIEFDVSRFCIPRPENVCFSTYEIEGILLMQGRWCASMRNYYCSDVSAEIDAVIDVDSCLYGDSIRLFTSPMSGSYEDDVERAKWVSESQ